MHAAALSATTWQTAPNATVKARVIQMAAVFNKYTVARAGQNAIRGGVLDLHSAVSYQERPLLRPKEEKDAGKRHGGIWMSGRRSQNSIL